MPSSFDTDSIRFHNLDVVINNIKSVGEGAPKYMQDVLMRCMTDDIWPLWIRHISLQDHSLADLAKLGHPYSTRLPVDSGPHDDSEVHRQSGSLVEASHIDTSSGSIKLINTSPHYIFLRYGTRQMRLRDPAGEVMKLAFPLIKKRLKEEIKGAIIQLLRR